MKTTIQIADDLCHLVQRVVSKANLLVALILCCVECYAEAPVDLSNYSPTSGITVSAQGGRVTMKTGGTSMVLDLRDDQPLIASLGEGLTGLDPLVIMTVGTREQPSGRPPDMSVWNTFFDNPRQRAHQTHTGVLAKKQARVLSHGLRTTVTIGDLSVGPFHGEWSFTLFSNSPLVHMEAVVATDEDKRAFVFDLGLVGENPGWKTLAWTDVDGQSQQATVEEAAGDKALAVRHRLMAATTSAGSLVMFSPPHQFFYPLDLTTNTKNFWRGRGHQGQQRFGFGVRHDPRGAGNFVPWFNAPPGTRQRLSVFLLLGKGDAQSAMDEALRYTRRDRFAGLAGMTTFTTHYHMAISVDAMEKKARGVNPLPVPEFVKMFKDMGVQSVHLAEFHGDGHQDDPGPLRFPELQAMFDECARLSDNELLLIPGEEINTYLGISQPGRHPGHWMLLYPRPVFWTKVSTADQHFEETVLPFGKVHHVGSREEMVRLITAEHGLAWSAHPRIKASSWAPDIFRNEDFFKDDLWLGAAWKAMPADLSREKLGERSLNVLDDMCNWGHKKYLPGEVDVFKIDHTHELYGHMNINYLRLAKLPRYQDGWQPVLDALRNGAFFTTTGEILIRSFTIGGRESGQELQMPSGGEAEASAEIEWTFPLKFAELISGDGQKVYRERIELADTDAFGARTLARQLKLSGRKWARFEVWDVAGNGAYTQPVWLK